MSPLISQTILDADVGVLLADVGVSVTFRSRVDTSGTVDPSTGAVTNTYTTSALTAVPGRFSASEVAHSGGLLTMQDRWFLFRASDLPDTVRVEDEFTVGSDTYEVHYIDPDEIGASVVIVARKV